MLRPWMGGEAGGGEGDPWNSSEEDKVREAERRWPRAVVVLLMDEREDCG